ncbi:progestin and adipoQ receptor family member 4 [Anoplophora glabripennis]|uniref:progestin and adipoQ receptor family member 4 n=1 Tax=Anoplophora glabripennis TaxID=217634 RepID=UPI000873A11D|nr:progestin and adipoQ receptor family member 4 [Anoplophora glabripennis]
MTEPADDLHLRHKPSKQDNSLEHDEENKNYKKSTLLHWRDMPEHLQFNPHILTGYRPLTNAWGCVNSMWYLHNETINIVTHAFPILYILLTVPQILPWSQADLRFLAWCHIAGILCPWIGSFIYHLFMNLHQGPKAYYILLQVDMLGIWVSQSFGAMPMIFATSYCLPHTIRSFLITSYCLLSIWGLYKALTAWSPWERRLCFLLPFIMRILLWCLRVTSFGGGDPAAFTHVILQDVVSIAGGAIGALHIPEKWFPGCVDMYLNSHNIMHIMVVAAVYFMHTATMRDLNWMSRVDCSAAL